MKFLSAIAVFIVSALHFAFMALEMFYWDHELGYRLFKITPELAEQTAALAANQGLYNGILAVGVLWGLVAGKRDVVIFFLLSVIIAGVFGAATISPRILFTQATPAFIALVLTFLSRPKTA